MKDNARRIAESYAIMGLKCRDAQAIESALKEHYQVTCSDTDGFLEMAQNDAPVTIATVLKSFYQKHPECFVGYVGAPSFKSDLLDREAKTRFIREHGLAAWDALPATPNSPTSKYIVKPILPSSEMKQAEWLQLTPKERCAAITAWGGKAVQTVERIMSRRARAQ